MSKPRLVHSIWTLLDSHWCCTLCECAYTSGNYISCELPDCCLAQYLWNFGFDIPDSIDFCIAHSSQAFLKFRVFGNKIHVYLNLC